MTRQVSDVEINILEVVLHDIGDWIWKLETVLVDAYLSNAAMVSLWKQVSKCSATGLWIDSNDEASGNNHLVQLVASAGRKVTCHRILMKSSGYEFSSGTWRISSYLERRNPAGHYLSGLLSF